MRRVEHGMAQEQGTHDVSDGASDDCHLYSMASWVRTDERVKMICHLHSTLRVWRGN